MNFRNAWQTSSGKMQDLIWWIKCHVIYPCRGIVLVDPQRIVLLQALKQQVAELDAAYEADASRIRELPISEEARQEMLEELDRKFIDGLDDLV
jgi:hypothetical protein